MTNSLTAVVDLETMEGDKSVVYDPENERIALIAPDKLEEMRANGAVQDLGDLGRESEWAIYKAMDDAGDLISEDTKQAIADKIGDPAAEGSPKVTVEPLPASKPSGLDL